MTVTCFVSKRYRNDASAKGWRRRCRVGSSFPEGSQQAIPSGADQRAEYRIRLPWIIRKTQRPQVQTCHRRLYKPRSDRCSFVDKCVQVGEMAQFSRWGVSLLTVSAK